MGECCGIAGMREWIDRLEQRTAQFAVDVIALCKRLRYAKSKKTTNERLERQKSERRSK